MSMIDWLIIAFAVIVALLCGLAWAALSLAYTEICKKWTCDPSQVPAPSALMSPDGGTI